MTSYTPYFTLSNIFNDPVLAFPAVGTLPAYTIPTRLTQLDVVTTNATLVEWSSGPVVDQPSNNAVGGNSWGEGVNQLPKLVMAGWIDTPAVEIEVPGMVGTAEVPGIIQDGFRMTYAEIIAMFYEGRTSTYNDYSSVTPGTYWQKVDPLYFRDPMGRVYNNPRIYTFTATRLEAQPFRTNFNMTLQLVGV